MPRLNMLVISITTIVSILCYHRVVHTREATYVADAIEVIRSHGLEDVERQELFNAAMDGMVSELDRFSGFVTRDEKEQFTQDLENQFPGIGIRPQATKNEETGMLEIVVVDTLVGSPRPAHDAGIRSGDRIVAVDGYQLSNIEWDPDDDDFLYEAMNRIKGPAGTQVAITVARDDQELTFDVTRQEIEVDTVLGDTRDAEGQWEFTWAADPRIGYIRVVSFGKHTASELARALKKLQAAKPLQALIIDLRDNRGGILDTAVEMCDLFIDRSKFGGKIVSTRDRFGKDHDVHWANSTGTFNGFPMVVLVNGESASASEILSACLQDHGRAMVCGTRTYGKGVVQQMIPMERGRSILHLTTRSFWRPSNKQIHKMKDATVEDDWGVRPDEGFEVPLTDEQEKQRLTERQERDAAERDLEGVVLDDGANKTNLAATATPLFDPQLQRAVEHLQAQLEKKSK